VNEHIHSTVRKARGDTMKRLKWIVVVCVFPFAALGFSIAVCSALVVSLATELHQQFWPSR
jgi:hypothetical protein